jgi:hypothetical protein
MKLIKYIFFASISIIVFVCLGGLVFFKLPSNQQNFLIKILVDKTLHYLDPNISVQSAAIDVRNRVITINGLQGDIQGTTIAIPKLTIDYKIQLYRFDFDLKCAEMIINGNRLMAGFDLSYVGIVWQQKRFINLELAYDGEKSLCDIKIKKDNLMIRSCDLKLNGSQLDLSGNIENYNSNFPDLKLQATFKNLSLQSYRLLNIFARFGEVLKSLDDVILGGAISGNLDVNLSAQDSYEIRDDNFNGKIFVDRLALRYDVDFPPVERVESQIIIKGKSMQGGILKGLSGKINILNGTVNFVWQGLESSVIKIDLNAQGPSALIADFIIPEKKLALKKKGIDFAKTGGVLKAAIQVDAFLAEDKKNIVKIGGMATGFKVNAMDEKLTIEKANLKFSINDNVLIAEGSGLINGYSSKINYEQDLLKSNFAILANVSLQNLINSNQSIIDFDGSSTLLVTYKDFDDVVSINAKSDLTNSAIRSQKLNLEKVKGEKCFLNITNNSKGYGLKFKISGSQQFNAEGTFDLMSKKLNLQYLHSPNMQLAGVMQVEPNKTIATLFGSRINLSHYDLFNFVKKNSSGSNVDLNLKFDQVILKNNVMMQDLEFKMKCDFIKCFEGGGRAYINTKPVSMSLTSDDIEEKWHINSNDAGSFFSGLGIYSKIKNGVMSLSLSTKRSLVSKGELLPITHGKLAIDDFYAIKNPFLTKIVSITSLPGLINIITNSNQVKFDKLEADFKLDHNMISIANCNAIGPDFDLMLRGDIMFFDRKIKLRGSVIPSVYGINSLLKKIPVINQVVGKRRGVIAAPFSINDKY